jgi:hypothetical protein
MKKGIFEHISVSHCCISTVLVLVFQHTFGGQGTSYPLFCSANRLFYSEWLYVLMGLHLDLVFFFIMYNVLPIECLRLSDIGMWL